MFNPSSKFQRRVNSKMWKRRKLFYATDFQSLMYPSFTVCRIFGMFPYRINASTIEIHKPLFILWTVIICVCCICGSMMLYQIYISGRINMTSVPRILERSSYYTLCNFIAVVTYILSVPRMRLLQTILDISSTLPSKSYRKLSWLIHTKDIIGFISILWMATTSYTRMNFDGLLRFFVIYITLLVFQMDMMYVNCVCLLKACFKRINDNLANLQKHLVNDETRFLKLIYHEQRNPFLLMELKALKKQHLMVSETVRMLNMVFSLQLLATIILTFTKLTFNIYYYILQWKENILVFFMEKQYYFLYFAINVIAFFVTKMSLIVWACETGKNQALEIGTTVHDVLNSTNDRQIKDELHLFSLQILHCTNTFSAKGLTVDATLLAAIAGNVTTYILILMQFLDASHYCDEEIAINVIQSA